MTTTTLRNYLVKHNLALRYLLVIVTITTSYIFAITFVQLGLPNFGKVTLGLKPEFVNTTILLFAIVGGVSAILGGHFLLRKFRNNIHHIILIRAIFVIVTLAGRSLWPWITTGTAYVTWIIFLGVIMGLGASFSYALVYLLLPPRNRGLVGGIITAIVYGIANVSLPDTWSLDTFSHGMLIPSILTYTGYVLLAVFVIGRPVSQAIVDENIGVKPYRNYNVKGIFVILTLVLFIDSFGFLRVVEGTEDLANLTWHGGMPMLIYTAIVHVVSALFFGYLYNRKSPMFLIKTALILFFVADLFFVLFYGNPQMLTPLAYLFVLFYAPAVSIYTIVYIVLIADLVTKESMGTLYGLYFGIVGWIASFISTGISLSVFELISPKTHLAIAGALSLITFLILLATVKEQGTTTLDA